MTPLQKYFLLAFVLLNAYLAYRGFVESSKKKNAYGLTPKLLLLGMFVWGDAVVFGAFWVLAAAVSLVVDEWILFWLFFSIFWVVRSLGESIYWFNQQFSTVIRNDPAKTWLFKHFHNDSTWFIVQIVHQSIMVVSIVSSLYFIKLWFRI